MVRLGDVIEDVQTLRRTWFSVLVKGIFETSVDISKDNSRVLRESRRDVRSWMSSVAGGKYTPEKE